MIAPGLNDGDKVVATLPAELVFAPDGTIELAIGDNPPHLVPIDPDAEGVTVSPADAPTPLDVALSAIADKAADFAATAERCLLPEVDRVSLAKEHRVRADAAVDALVAAIEAAAGADGSTYGGPGLPPFLVAVALVDAATRKLAGGAL